MSLLKINAQSVKLKELFYCIKCDLKFVEIELADLFHRCFPFSANMSNTYFTDLKIFQFDNESRYGNRTIILFQIWVKKEFESFMNHLKSKKTVIQYFKLKSKRKNLMLKRTNLFISNKAVTKYNLEEHFLFFTQKKIQLRCIQSRFFNIESLNRKIDVLMKNSIK